MLSHMLGVFVDVVLPVFLIVGTGYVLGPRLGLEARTLNRVSGRPDVLWQRSSGS